MNRNAKTRRFTNAERRLQRRIHRLELRTNIGRTLRNPVPKFNSYDRRQLANPRRFRRGRTARRTFGGVFTTVAHCEANITNVKHGLNAYRVEPGKSGFPVLDQLATLYDTYRFTNRKAPGAPYSSPSPLNLRFKSAAATNISGQVIFGIDYLDNGTILTPNDVRGLEHSCTTNIFEPTFIRADPTKAMKASLHGFTHKYQARVRQIPTTAFTLYVYVDTAKPPNGESLDYGSVELEYTIQLRGINVTDPATPPAAVIQTPTLVTPYGPLAKTTPTAAVESADPDTDLIVLDADDNIDIGEIAGGRSISTVQLGEMALGDEFSVLVSNEVKTGTALLALIEQRLPGVKGKLSVEAPYVRIKYPDGTPIPISKIKPLGLKPNLGDGSQTMGILGVKPSLQNPEDGFLDILGNVFKVVAPIATAIFPAAAPIVDVIGSFIPHIDGQPIPIPLTGTDDDDRDEFDLTPKITVIGLGDTIDVNVRSESISSLVDYVPTIAMIGWSAGKITNLTTTNTYWQVQNVNNVAIRVNPKITAKLTIGDIVNVTFSANFKGTTGLIAGMFPAKFTFGLNSVAATPGYSLTISTASATHKQAARFDSPIDGNPNAVELLSLNTSAVSTQYFDLNLDQLLGDLKIADKEGFLIVHISRSTLAERENVKPIYKPTTSNEVVRFGHKY